jgi:hypothetical protein
MKHCVGQPAGLSVLLAWMVGCQKHKSTLKGDDLAMSEAWPWRGGPHAESFDGLQGGSEGDLSERHDNPDLPKQRKLLQEEGATALKLHGGRLVIGWGASGRRGDVTIDEAKAVVTVCRGRLVGETETVQSAVQKVAASIAGEDPARPVSAVRGGGQSDHQQPRARIAEPGHRAPPVLPVAEAPHLLAGDPLPMPQKPRASPAADDLLAERVKLPRGAVSLIDPVTPFELSVSNPRAQDRQGLYPGSSSWLIQAIERFVIVLWRSRRDKRLCLSQEQRPGP